MGNTGRSNSAGSQFFIMHADAPSLDGRYTVIGRVRSGIEVVDAIVDVEIDRSVAGALEPARSRTSS